MTAAASTQSARARKRQRQKMNQKGRATDALDEAIQAMRRFPTLSNGLNAWLLYLQQGSAPSDHRSATNFARVFRNECVRCSEDGTLPDRQWITTEMLTILVHEFAGSFILDKNIERSSKISRIGSNLCSFVFFLGKHEILPLSDIEKLHDYCSDLGQSMIRSVRAERVGEAYSDYVRAAYSGSQCSGDIENVSLFKGGFEVAHVGQRFCLLQDWPESGLDHVAFQDLDPVKVRFPLPMTKQLKNGDHIHLEIRRLRESSVWVPTECYGVYPEGADDDDARISQTRTPTERSEAARKAELNAREISDLLDREYEKLSVWTDKLSSDQGSTECLSESMSKLHVTLGQVRQGFSWRRDYVKRIIDDLPPDGFEESRFTDGYFASMETDIGDNDQGFGIWEDGSDPSSSSSGDETE